MADDDPWDWNVDRVVQELCTTSRSWAPRSSSAARPDATLLEVALRHHEIDGVVLLSDISDQELRNELGLNRLAQKAYIRHAIEELRQRSVQYSKYKEKRQPSTHGFSAEHLHRGLQDLQQQVKTLQGSICGSPSRGGHATYTPVNGDDNYSLETQNKRPRLEADAANLGLVENTLNEQFLDGGAPTIGLAAPQDAIQLPTNEKKRKRIAPTLISSEIEPNRNRKITTAADSVVIYRPPESGTDDDAAKYIDEAIEPGLSFVGLDGRKRIVPILQPGPVSSIIPAYDDHFKQTDSTLVIPQTRNIRDVKQHSLASNGSLVGYLGKIACPIDQVFYCVKPGEEIDNTDETGDFLQQQEQIPPGRRQYVNRRIKKFLRSEITFVQRDDRSFYVNSPYSKDLIPPYQKASITVFSSKDGNIAVRRELSEAWSAWIDEKPKPNTVDTFRATFNPLGPDSNIELSYNNWDPSALEKYKFLEGGDEVLPLYGDSDSDNEYDDATLREMEDEQQSPLKDETRTSSRPALDEQDVSDAIDDGIASLVETWKMKQLPQLEQKAWKLWSKSRKRNTKLEQILAAQKDVEHLNQRLAKIRAEIAATVWTSKRQVIKQTTSMERSVFGRETLLWMIAMLQRKRMPNKPIFSPLAITRGSRSTIPMGDDGESLQTHSEASSSEEDLDGFIVEDNTDDGDTNALLDDDEMVVLPADSEDDISTTDSDSSSPDGLEAVDTQSIGPIVLPKEKRSSQTPYQHTGTPQLKDEAVADLTSASATHGRELIDLTITSSDDAAPRYKGLHTKLHRITDKSVTPKVHPQPSSVNLVTPPRVRSNLAHFVSPNLGSPTKNNGNIVRLNPRHRLVNTDDEDEEPRSAHRREQIRRTMSATSEDEIPDDVSPRKRKLKFVEDKAAAEMRKLDKQRHAEQEARRQKLHAKFGSGDDIHSQIIVNEGVDGGHFSLNDHIAQRVKKHQIRGIRFLWDSTITESKELQGCLLAHTMGLGKTMQAISLLISIAEASASKDESISSQIPERLRISKTLVLCPPGLINNWMDELLLWVNPKDLLGELRKIDASMSLASRLHHISEWHREGGILVIGYEMFRNLVQNKGSAKRDAQLTAEQHVRVKDELVKGPNIVVADEAHKMKSSTSGLSKAAEQFETKCRIALTGSPLANNVAEYHTMINWVAPNYLGPAPEFRAKFVDPIQQGLYGDSTPSEKRRALKMLGVLERDIHTKVNRADMSVLKHDLPAKVEFTITVPLTKLQEDAYTVYVQAMTHSTNQSLTKDGEIKTTTLWHWLSMLTLLCNHPSAFKAKLNERIEDAAAQVKASKTRSHEATDAEETPDNDDAVDLDAQLKVDMSRDLIEQETRLLDIVDDINAVELSNKAQILCQILDAADAAGDKTLIFSQSILTLNYIDHLCNTQGRFYYRLDGKTKMSTRQHQTKLFNDVDNPVNVFLISTMAGGLGLNLPGANRVVIFDFKFNPIQEEQAIGRAYRIGQQKKTFVYRFLVGGTFETIIHNTTIFKQQLASRVVDKKSILAMAMKKASDFLFLPKEVDRDDLSEFEGVDDLVLDKILETQDSQRTICKIVQSDIFEKDDEEKLTAEEEEEVAHLLEDQTLRRRNGFGTLDGTPLEQQSANASSTAQKLVNTYHPVIIPPNPQVSFAPSAATKVLTPPSAVFLPPPEKPTTSLPRPDRPPAILPPPRQVREPRGQSPIRGSSVRVAPARESPETTLEPNALPVGKASDQLPKANTNASISSNVERPVSTFEVMTGEASPLALSPVKSTTSSRSRDSSGVHLARRSTKTFSRIRHSTAGSPRQRKQQLHDVNGKSHTAEKRSKHGSSTAPGTNENLGIKPTANNRRSPSVEEIEESEMFKAMNRKPPSDQSKKSLITPKAQKTLENEERRKSTKKEQQPYVVVQTSNLNGKIPPPSAVRDARRLPQWADDQLARKKDESRRRSSKHPVMPSARQAPKK